jgi:hypothetical protein
MSRRARTIWMIAGGVGLAIVVAGVAVLFAFRDFATPVGEEEIGLTVVTGAGAPGDFGYYVYATNGYESTDALAGARHDYPAETYLTIQPGGCGTLVRWQPLDQRYDEWNICPDGRMAGWDSFNEWFQVKNTDHWQCADPVPLQQNPGTTWTSQCAKVQSEEAGASTEVASYEAVGYETLMVAGQEVETLHVRTTQVETGGSDGSGHADLWYLPGTPLVVRRVEVHDSTTGSRIGPVQYHEEVELQLTSLLPRG